MINVAIHPDKHPVAREFFELFKTEWTLDDASENYQVLLTDGSDPPEGHAALRIIFSAGALPGDSSSQPAPAPPCGFRFIHIPDGPEWPLYTPARLFTPATLPQVTEKASGRTVAYAEKNLGRTTVRVGYDLFAEVQFLLSAGQPPENADIPALDRHIDFLRQLILSEGLPLVEIPPCPPGYDFMVCLTHDVDFVSIRNHQCDTTVRGFMCRAFLGSVQRLFKKRLTFSQLLTNWRAALSVPFIHLGICKDFWNQFESYRRIEGSRRSTFFLIPFRDHPGGQVHQMHPERRAARYDLEALQPEIASMQHDGWEFGLHGIDAWHSGDAATAERKRITSVSGTSCAGVRMHWLCRNEKTDLLLDRAGFAFDSTSGFNETIGFRAGTSQVFRPIGATRLLEIPLHIQDVALFYPSFLDLDETTAWDRCMEIMAHQQHQGGVLTLLWHMRSLAPERLWGGFYERLLNECARSSAWIGTAGETARWFEARRCMHLSTRLSPSGRLSVFAGTSAAADAPDMILRIHKHGASFTDVIWHGHEPEVALEPVEVPA